MAVCALKTRGLTRRYGALLAVDAVDLRVKPGEIYAFLGRNGAGKTTTIRMLLGLLRPDSGRVELLGQHVEAGRAQPELWSQVGYLVETPGLYPQLTVAEHLRIAAVYRSLAHTDTEAVIARMSLGRVRDVRAKVLSLGNRQRLGLALALAHRPRLVLLDEPANGLDPAGVADVRELLRELSADGVTVFMSSHIMGEVTRLADRVGIIHDGRLIEELAADQLQAESRQRVVADIGQPSAAAHAQHALRLAGHHVVVDGSRLISVDPRTIAAPAQIATLLVEAGTPPCYLAVEHEDLEQRFLRLTAATR